MGAHESHCVASAQPWRAVVLHRLVSALRVEVSHGDSACVQLWATALPRSCARSISNLRMTSPFGTHRGRLPATLAAALPPLDCWQGATKPPPFHAWGGHPARAYCLDRCAQTTAAVHAALRTTRRSAAAARKKADAECLLAFCAGQLRPALPRSSRVSHFAKAWLPHHPIAYLHPWKACTCAGSPTRPRALARCPCSMRSTLWRQRTSGGDGACSSKPRAHTPTECLAAAHLGRVGFE